MPVTWRIDKAGEYAGTPLYNLVKIEDKETYELREQTLEFIEGFSLGVAVEEVEGFEGEEIRSMRSEVYRVYKEGV